MAGGLNKATLIGNLGADPEMRATPNGQSVANFRIATSETYTDKQGQKQERTEWHRIVVWGKLAELCGEYLKKGRQCYIEGRLQTREWTDKDGNKKYTTEVVAQDITFLRDGSGGAGGGSAGGSSRGGGARGGGGGGDFGGPPPDMDYNQGSGGGNDDIPF